MEQSEKIEYALELLHHARKPLFLLGGGVNIAKANREIELLSDITGIPVVTTIMGKGAIPTNHELYVGNIGIHGSYAANTAISNCDVLCAIGTRFNDRITGKAETFAPKAKLIHIDIEPDSKSGNLPVFLSITFDANEAISVMSKKAVPLEIGEWKQQIKEWKAKYPLCIKGKGITPQKIIESINTQFADVIVTTDVGQNQLWTTQFLELTPQKQLITSGGFGTMGYGLPAAIGAKIGNPERTVIAISGDGGIQMNIQELATAVAYELPIIICIFNNGYLGNVRQWQELFFEKRYSGTCMRYRKSCGKNCGENSSPADKKCPAYTPDFIRLAESYGAKGIRVSRPEEIKEAFRLAKEQKTRPTVIEFIIDPEANVMPIVPPGNAIDDMLVTVQTAARHLLSGCVRT